MTEMKTYTGRLKYKDQDFTFVFDGDILKLIPDNRRIIFSWTHDEIAKGAYVPHYPISIEVPFLIGNCNETNSEAVFFFFKGSTISQENDTFSLTPRAYILCTNELGKIKSISFTCPELDMIFPVSNAYCVPISKEIIEDG